MKREIKIPGLPEWVTVVEYRKIYEGDTYWSEIKQEIRTWEKPKRSFYCHLVVRPSPYGHSDRCMAEELPKPPPGLSLREQLATAALPAVILACAQDSTLEGASYESHVAIKAYRIADEMLKARNRGKEAGKAS